MGKNATFNVDDKVFAKVKGYPPWPANIVGDNKNKKYHVVFYGTKETGNIKVEDICYFNQNRDSFVQKYKKRAGYEEAVKEIEAAIKKQGGDGSDKNPEASKQNDSKFNDSIVSDLDLSQPEKPQKTSVAEKKVVKRKVQSLPDEPKKASGRPTRKSAVGATEPLTETGNEKVDSEDTVETDEPAAKKTKKSALVEEKMEELDIKSDEPAAKKARTKSVSADEKSKPKNDAKAEENGITQRNGKKEEDKTKNEVKVLRSKTEQKNEIKKDNEYTAETDVSVTAASTGEAKKSTEPQEKYEFVAEKLLEYNILYGKHVADNENLYKERLTEPREDHKNQILAVELPSGVVCGLKLHKVWPLMKFPNEVERALYDRNVAASILGIKEQLLCNKTKLEDHPDIIIPDIHTTAGEVKTIIQMKLIESTKMKAERLRTEANLVTLDGKIKNSLGLDNADPIRALDHLKQFEKVKIDAVMMKKHPHIMDTIRRLRKYVGNIKDWKMTEEELDEFNKKASKIRAEAEKVYNRLKKTIKVPTSKPTFWEGFLELVAEFRSHCTKMVLNEKQVSMLCAEPSSRKAFLDRLEDSEPETAAN